MRRCLGVQEREMGGFKSGVGTMSLHCDSTFTMSDVVESSADLHTPSQHHYQL